MESYLAAAQLRTLDIATQFECSLRAWTIARLIKNPSAELAARQTIAFQIALDLDTGTALIPGLVLPALATIASANRPCGPELFDLDQLLDRALDLYGTPHHIDVIADLICRWRRDDTTVIGDMRRKRVQVRLDAGNLAGDIAMKLHWFEQAAQLASQLGITDLREEATSSLQALDTSALPWVHIPFDAAPRQHLVETFAHQFVRAGWRQGLISWLSTDAPSGHHHTNLEITRNSLAGTVLHTLMPTWTFGAHGLPQRTSDAAIEGMPDASVRDTEYFSALLHGGMLAEALDRIGHLSSTTDSQDVEAVIHEYFLCSPADARILVRALRLYWRGDYVEAVHLITPFTESGARRLLLLLDEPIYRVEEAKKKRIGQYLGLGALLPLLKKQGLDHDWVRYLETMLLPEKMNYRNLIAHGFLYDTDRVTAALLIRASAVLLLMPGLSSPDATIGQASPSLSVTRPKLRPRIRLVIAAARWAFDGTRS